MLAIRIAPNQEVYEFRSDADNIYYEDIRKLQSCKILFLTSPAPASGTYTDPNIPAGNVTLTYSLYAFYGSATPARRFRTFRTPA
jgi:hypothetical protein